MPKFALSVEIEPSGVARLQLGLRRLSEETGRAMTSLVVQAARFGVQSARKLTPLAKLRKMRRLPSATRRRLRTRRKAEGIPWWAEYQVTSETGGTQRRLFTRDRASAMRLRTPVHRGLAKAAWTWGLRKTGEVTEDPGKEVSAIANAQSVVIQTADKHGHRVEIAVQNKLRYVGVIAPHAAAQGTAKGVNRLRGYMRSLAQQLESGADL